MKASTKQLLTVAVAALFAGALASGCSSGGSGDGGAGTTGSQGNGSGGTSGSHSSGGSSGAATGTGGSSGGSAGSTGGTGGCYASGTACTNTAGCCTGLACSSGTCQACGKPTEPCCAGNSCNTGLTCDQSGGATNNTCIVATNADAGCLLSDAGGPCATLIDCYPPDICQLPPDGGNGVCGPLGTQVPKPACLANNSTCPSTTSPGEPCCGGSCINGTCTPRTACGVTGQSCATNGDCCNDYQCAVADGGGVCQPTCQGQNGVCATSADCCAQQGLVCLQTGLDAGPAGICDFLSNATPAPVPCDTNPCSGNECVLGSLCNVDATTGADPCTPAGYVCDFSNHVCRNPIEGEACTVGGAACANAIPPSPFGGSTPSTANDIACLPLPGAQGGATFCLQPCSNADPFQGTSDCLDRNTTCKAVTGGGICQPNQALGGCGGQSKVLGACTSEVAGDSLCMPITFASTNQLVGFCLQGTLDGGGPGSACLENTNRQQGGFCNPDSFCILGLCEANCNAGVADAGPQLYCTAPQSCLDSIGQNTDPLDQGNCEATCDFTDPAGGGCPASADGGVPQKCIPETFYTGTDSANGLCTSAPAQLTATGQVCQSAGNYFDGCVDGSLCLGSAVGGDTCLELCDLGGQKGTPCPAPQTCHPVGLSATTSSQYIGYCQ